AVQNSTFSSTPPSSAPPLLNASHVTLQGNRAVGGAGGQGGVGGNGGAGGSGLGAGLFNSVGTVYLSDSRLLDNTAVGGAGGDKGAGGVSGGHGGRSSGGGFINLGGGTAVVSGTQSVPNLAHGGAG